MPCMVGGLQIRLDSLTKNIEAFSKKFRVVNPQMHFQPPIHTDEHRWPRGRGRSVLVFPWLEWMVRAARSAADRSPSERGRAEHSARTTAHSATGAQPDGEQPDRSQFDKAQRPPPLSFRSEARNLARPLNVVLWNQGDSIVPSPRLEAFYCVQIHVVRGWAAPGKQIHSLNIPV